MSTPSPSFPALRYAILRAIAESWKESEFLDKLTEKSDEGTLLQFLEKRYNFLFPWDINLRISTEERSKWEPNLTGGWWGTGVDLFELHLPGRPTKDVASSDYPEILARYSSEFPSLLGRSVRTAGFFAREHLPVEPPDEFMSFGVVTARLVAASWGSDEFAHRLFDPEKSGPDIVQFINNSMDYIYPWSIVTRFHRHRPVPPPGTDAHEEYWHKFPRSSVVLGIPQPPDAGAGDRCVESVALAAYDGTGGQYPFTCCA